MQIKICETWPICCPHFVAYNLFIRFIHLQSSVKTVVELFKSLIFMISIENMRAPTQKYQTQFSVPLLLQFHIHRPNNASKQWFGCLPPPSYHFNIHKNKIKFKSEKDHKMSRYLLPEHRMFVFLRVKLLFNINSFLKVAVDHPLPTIAQRPLYHLLNEFLGVFFFYYFNFQDAKQVLRRM